MVKRIKGAGKGTTYFPDEGRAPQLKPHSIFSAGPCGEIGNASSPSAQFSTRIFEGFSPSPYPDSFDDFQAQKLWLDGQAALAQATMLLAREQHASAVNAREHMFMQAMKDNSRLAQENRTLEQAMQENARLARENRILREQAHGGFQPPRPPGLGAETHSGSIQVPSEKATLKKSMKEALKKSGKASKPPKGNWCKGVCFSTELDEAPTSLGTSFTDSAPSSLNYNADSFVPVSLSEEVSASDSARKQLIAFCAASASSAASLQAECASEGASEEPPLMPCSSVMMRNLPNDYTRSSLLELLHAQGFEGKYDFVYLPIDFISCAGLGYAFINFVSLEIAEQFKKHFDGFNSWSSSSTKVCKVAWSNVRGLDAHIEHFRNSPVMHESVPDALKPVLFQGSERLTFPEPTKNIRLPRHWHRRK